ncbi:MAG: DUF354 domain-containing protein [Candidatus Thorarchaeota archaeon]
MNYLFELGHPAHVYLFKNTIMELMKKGHNIKIVIRERENMVGPLLSIFNLKYENLNPTATGIVNKALAIFNNDIKLLKISKRFKPDMFVSCTTPYSAQASAIAQRPHIGLGDTEGVPTSQLKMTVPFTEAILTPDSYFRKLPKRKHIKYAGYHELAYLHPNRFKPDRSVLETAGLSEDDLYLIIRFSSWDAYHDVGQKVFNSLKERIDFVKKMERYGKIFITSEIPLPKSLEKYRLSLSPEKMHHLLWYSSMYIGEGATLASEAGVLGVPWIWLCGKERLGYLTDQETNFRMGYNIPKYDDALKKVEEIFKNYSNVKSEWHKRRKKLLEKKIDVTAFVLWFIENYPDSHSRMLENPNYDKSFK